MSADQNGRSAVGGPVVRGTTRPPDATRPPGTAPYIVAWSSERALPVRIVHRNGGIGYADEHPYDRDATGVLWRRIGISPGKGTPEFGRVHTLRQRQAMQRVLCQICGGKADETRAGVLWLMGRQEYEDDPWPAPIESPHPPVCLTCAVRAVRSCPHLRDHYVALRIRSFRLAGVYGALHGPAVPLPIAERVTTIGYDDARIRWMQAGQLVMRLAEYTVVRLAGEASARGLST